MPSGLKEKIQQSLSKVHDQPSFFQHVLGGALAWPIGNASRIDEISFPWSSEDLHAVNLDRAVIDGSISQIQPAVAGEPWGIFVLEFKRPDLLSPHGGMAGVLRAVLRGLVGSRRKDAKLPSWKREHLLFICTHGWQSFRFAYFRTRPDDPKASRLTTFGWAPGTSNRTVCEFNLPALVWPSDTSDAAEWVRSWSEAFNKEPLTRDFFRRFNEVLVAIKSDLQEYQRLPSAEAYTQAQLLLERLLFLYFLQNRGWLNQDRRYLPNQLKDFLAAPEAFTYYSEFLDKLFWTLSSPPGAGGRFSGIPFLNGGLFDDDEFAQPAVTRKTNPPLKVRNATSQRVFNELLEAFNFTVTEDTPLNQEVAVDPEMLGKVFESIVLHAEAADPDATAPDKRKATGSYYTPRIVVHFICREVLYQYLHARLGVPGFSPASSALKGGATKDDWATRLRTLLEMDASDGLDEDAKERLKRTITPAQAVQLRDLVLPLKCCDPAVGSGAFPVGLLHELVNLRRLLTTAANGYVDPVRGEGSTWLHDTKANIVQNCLFGVDIQQQAIEICRLRLWLTLVVDYDLGLDPFTAEKSQFSGAISRISQLPNLEMNFHRGDSLHDHICGVPIVILPDRASRHADAFRGIHKLGDRLHKAKTGEQKRKLRLEILEKRLALSGHILDDELRALRSQDSALDGLFGLAESAAKKRERLTREIELLERALKKVEDDREELERLKNRVYDKQFYPKLRKLEGADFDSPFNFAWTIDFPGIFAGGANGGGFDIIVGNPPFVTARNPKKRELWRERWPLVCHMKYSLVAPFFQLSFGLLRRNGELGFIVSNAFAKRDFGQALVERFFPTVDLQKVVDCSGLLFPGHGTPTCVVFGRNTKPNSNLPVRVVAILPGGGDLRTPPEESQLWHAIARHHDQPGHIDNRIEVADRNRGEMSRFPWNLEASAKQLKETLEKHRTPLTRFLPSQMGVALVTGANDIFSPPPHCLRVVGVAGASLVPYVPGEYVRNWTWESSAVAIFPYTSNHRVRRYHRDDPELRWLSGFIKTLQERIYFGQTPSERGMEWYEYAVVVWPNCDNANKLIFPDLATHGHFVRVKELAAFNQHTPVLALPLESQEQHLHFVAGLLNSSAALFWLKQVSFNKGAGEDEQRDRFEYAGGKVQQLPVPQPVAEALQGKPNALAERLTELSRACWERGQQMPSLALKKLFEKPGEAYHEWNSSLPGHVPPNPELDAPFQTESDLRDANLRAQTIRERLRAEMIALQEEMDWLVYAAYGLLPENHPAVSCHSEPRSDQGEESRSDRQKGQGEIPRFARNDIKGTQNDMTGRVPLDQAERPFRLWQRVEGDYDKAVKLIPASWPAERRALWEARLAAIRDNEHIRRIEQPVYKRRWDEQWKVGNQWRCGPVAYAAEFIDAFEWWLREKAESWLEHKKSGGPVELDEWAAAMWKDPRVLAAWPVAAENFAFLEHEKEREKAEDGEPSPGSVAALSERRPGGEDTPATAGFPEFRREFKHILDEETVPEDIPWAVPYDDLEKKLKSKVPAKVKSVRGKLNVPRERFHLRGKSLYLWAGLQFR